jgi:magnesium transporter
MLAFHPYTPPGEDGAAPAETVWIDLLNATEAEARLVEDHVGFALPDRASLSAIEQSSRLAFDDGVLRLSAPVMAKADTDYPELSHIGMILTPKLLITVRFDDLRMFEETAARTCAPGKTASSLLVFTALMEAFADRHADLLELARKRLDELSHAVFRTGAATPRKAMQASGVMRRKMLTLGRINERVSLIRESMLAFDRIIPFALESGRDWFAPEQAQRLRGVRSDLDSLTVFAEHLSDKVQFLLDAVLGFINIEQNDIFKVLTIASVVGIFPTLVVGWYGMNFHGMPELEWAWGYPYGIAVVILSTIAPLAWFKWRGWM